ncbi:hypothetical protein M1403_00895 [Patescibacteria group bacterium]|nr:hypothetical protein [Patescibacteria group bacterium]
MLTLILGGGSFKNKAWVEEMAQTLGATPQFYDYWSEQKDSGLDFDLETNKALKTLGGQPYNLLIKSVGSLLGMRVLEKAGGKVNKIIICGFPLHDFPSEELERYKVLNSFPVEKIRCFQNNADPHGSYQEAKTFLAKINPDIQIVEKIGDNHNYPYPEDFQAFLSEG